MPTLSPSLNGAASQNGAGHSALILDSRLTAARKRDELKLEIEAYKAEFGNAPQLVVVCVGDDAAIYDFIRIATAQARRVGIRAVAHVLSGQLTTAEVAQHLDDLSNDPNVHAIALQTPLPPGMALGDLVAHIHPDKDVEGYHPNNAGHIYADTPRLIPTPALGALQLLEAYEIDPAGMFCVVVGRNSIIGKPLSTLLMEVNATVVIGHRQTPNLEGLIQKADLLVLGASIPEGIPTSALKPGVIILDYGINYVSDGDTDTIVGNVDFEEALQIAGAITPMPGGTGPMTTISLLQNVLKAARLQAA